MDLQLQIRILDRECCKINIMKEKGREPLPFLADGKSFQPSSLSAIELRFT